MKPCIHTVQSVVRQRDLECLDAQSGQLQQYVYRELTQQLASQVLSMYHESVENTLDLATKTLRLELRLAITTPETLEEYVQARIRQDREKSSNPHR